MNPKWYVRADDRQFYVVRDTEHNLPGEIDSSHNFEEIAVLRAVYLNCGSGPRHHHNFEVSFHELAEQMMDFIVRKKIEQVKVQRYAPDGK